LDYTNNMRPDSSSQDPFSSLTYVEMLKRAFHDALEQADFDRAQQSIEAAMRLAPASATLKTLHASLLTRRGNLAAAAEEFEAASGLEPQMLEYLAYAACSWDLAGRLDRAGALTVRLLIADPLHPTGLTLAIKLLAQTDSGVIGCVWPQGTGIAGWAWDARRPQSRLKVKVRVGQLQVATIAQRPEPHLAAAGMGDGAHGFFIDLAPFTAPPTAVLAAEVDGMALLSSPQGRPLFQDVAGAAWCDGDTIRGWAWEAERPRARLSVTARCTDRWQQVVQADRFEPALVGLGIGDGCHGFVIPLPASLADEIAEIDVLADGHISLPGSPLLVAGGIRRATILGALSATLRGAASFPAHIHSPEAIAICREFLARVNTGTALPGWRQPAAANLRPRTAPAATAVGIVMPIYRGFAETAACLEALLSSREHNRTPFDIVVVDDASPDSALRRQVAALAEEGRIRLLTHAVNKGFAASVNAGMAVWPERDIVILNADTVVHGDWLDRLKRAAGSASDIGTVTPLSNNGSICSYPRINTINPMPSEGDFRSLDSLCAQVNAGDVVDIPTGVGFCMYIRRDCCAEVGPFDAAAFPRGYGEENDFCLRAGALGWRHVAAADVFVAHHGTVSFGTEKTTLLAGGMQVLDQRYPHYRRTIEHFLAADPLRPIRRRLDLERLAWRPATGATLLVTTDQEGGTARHVTERAGILQADGVPVLTLRPAGLTDGPSDHVRIAVSGHPEIHNLVFALPREADGMVAALRRLGLSRIEFHHLLNLPPSVLPAK
jgi:GT2 family glycosyltransferase